MAVLLDHARLEAALEEVADPVVAAVEPDRVEAVQALQAGGELGLRRPDDQVEVIRHQRPGMELPALSSGDISEQPHPGVAVERVEDDRAPLDSA